MPIRIQRVKSQYQAEVTPPHGGDRSWNSPEPMSLNSLIQALLDHGCHQVDIADALQEADPGWLSHLPPKKPKD